MRIQTSTRYVNVINKNYVKTNFSEISIQESVLRVSKKLQLREPECFFIEFPNQNCSPLKSRDVKMVRNVSFLN